MLALFEKPSTQQPDKIIRMVSPETLAMFAPESSARLIAHYDSTRHILRIDEELWVILTDEERVRILKTKDTHTFISQVLY